MVTPAPPGTGPDAGARASPGPLAGIRVLDLTQYLAGPYCTMLLADMGAEVVKVERPGVGEDNRRVGVVFVEGQGLLFMAINRNKKSLALNLKHERGRELFRELAAGADVVVENFRPGVMDGLGLGYASLAERNPALIYATVSGYGPGGPYAGKGGFDLILQGESGLISLNGEAGQPPAAVPLDLVDSGTGTLAALGVLAAVVARYRTGRGQRVDAALLNTALSWTVGHMTVYFKAGVLPERLGTANKLIAPSQAFRTRDGWLIFSAGSQALWGRACHALGAEHLAADRRFATNPDRVANRAALVQAIEAVLAGGTTAEWVARLDAEGVPCGPINTLDQAFAHPQVRHNGLVAEQHHPVAGPIKVPGPPVQLSDTPSTIRTPAPLVGEHTDAVLADWLGLDNAAITALRSDGVV